MFLKPHLFFWALIWYEKAFWIHSFAFHSCFTFFIPFCDFSFLIESTCHTAQCLCLLSFDYSCPLLMQRINECFFEDCSFDILYETSLGWNWVSNAFLFVVRLSLYCFFFFLWQSSKQLPSFSWSRFHPDDISSASIHQANEWICLLYAVHSLKLTEISSVKMIVLPTFNIIFHPHIHFREKSFTYLRWHSSLNVILSPVLIFVIWKSIVQRTYIGVFMTYDYGYDCSFF